MLRPENGYPLRVFIPGWKGNVSVKWLRRIKVVDQPWNFRSETARYTDPIAGGVASVQLQDGMQVGDHQAVGGDGLGAR